MAKITRLTIQQRTSLVSFYGGQPTCHVKVESGGLCENVADYVIEKHGFAWHSCELHKQEFEDAEAKAGK